MRWIILFGLWGVVSLVYSQPRCDRVLRIDPAAQAQLPGRPGYTLIFQDEFDGAVLDTVRWNPASPGNTRWDCDRGAMANPANARVAAGKLSLSVSTDTCGGCPFSMAEVKTSGPAARFKTFKFLPGSYMEIRAKVPLRANVTSAGWLLYMWLEEGVYREIDIWETRAGFPDRFQSNIHYKPGAGQSFWVCLEDSLGQSLRLDEQYLTFGLDWQQDRLRFYLNGQFCREISFRRQRLWFDWPMDIILGCTAASLNQDSLVTAELPATLSVDYIRVYWPEGRPLLRPLPLPDALEPQQAFGIRVPPFPHAQYRLESPGYRAELVEGDWAQFWWLTPETPKALGRWNMLKVTTTLETGYQEIWYCPFYTGSRDHPAARSKPSFRKKSIVQILSRFVREP